jgi:hypothetical protein
MAVIIWGTCAAVVITAAVRSRRHPNSLRTGRFGVGGLYLVGGAAVNTFFLLRGDDYATFADGSPISFVRHTWRTLVVPNHHAWISLLIAFEAAVGVLAVLGGRRTQVAYTAAFAFHVALLAFGWGFFLWSVPMLVALGTLLRAERRTSPTAAGPGHRRDASDWPTGRELVAEIGDVLHDLPAFLTAPLYRKWHQRWGATPAEVGQSLPGDGFLPRAQFRSTRAITIEAPPEAVWPWLVQVGCLRGGWYSNDLLDNLARPSATRIVPDLQDLVLGQWVPMAPSPTPTERIAFKVHSFEVHRCLLWSKPDSTWVWQLTPTGGHGTRLVTRVRASRDWRRPLSALLGLVLMEFGDFAMQRRMLRGIKERAENCVAPDVVGR